MAIRGLEPAVMSWFVGKNTAQNLTDSTPGTLLSAKNIMVLADNQIRRVPGYTEIVANITTLNDVVHTIYDFQRSVDSVQIVLVHVGEFIIAMNPDGNDRMSLGGGENSTPHVFVCNAFNAYSSNGTTAWRYVDVGGTLTKYQWGIDAPVTAPAIAVSAGTLNLTYGRQYVYCDVSTYVDSLGITRLQIGPPSPLSAHSGPVVNGVVTLSDLIVSADPQVNLKWIFCTTDSPLNTSATYFFAAEIPNSQTSWGDTLLDSQLDQTRLAPYDNNPAPPAPMLSTFQNRVVALNGNLMQLSGYDEITLGIPEESWPIDLFFNIPAGARRATAMIALNQGTTLAVCTLSFWFAYAGYDASSFTEQDRIASPGAVGPLALCITPFGVAFLSESKRLWLWNGTSAPTEISSDIAIAVNGTYSMEDLSAADLPSARLHWYSFGKLHFLAVFCRTSDAPDANLNLIQLWNVNIKGAQSSGEFTGSSGFFNQIGGLYETDKIPAISFTSSADVKLPSSPYIFTGDAQGNIYRFPDTFTDNGVTNLPMFSFPWSLLGKEAKKRFYWVDIYVESTSALIYEGGPLETYSVFAATAEAPDMNVMPTVPLELGPIPSPDGISPNGVRANLQAEGTNVGKYLRLWVQLPANINEDEIVLKIIVWFAPMYQGVP